jgi:hypothetical protein
VSENEASATPDAVAEISDDDDDGSNDDHINFPSIFHLAAAAATKRVYEQICKYIKNFPIGAILRWVDELLRYEKLLKYAYYSEPITYEKYININWKDNAFRLSLRLKYVIYYIK